MKGPLYSADADKVPCPKCGARMDRAEAEAGRYFCRTSCRREFHREHGAQAEKLIAIWRTEVGIGRPAFAWNLRAPFYAVKDYRGLIPSNRHRGKRRELFLNKDFVRVIRDYRQERRASLTV